MSTLWADPRVNGQGAWTNSPSHTRTRLTLLGTLVLCFVMTAVFLGFVAAGRAAMCATHHNHLTYCPGYVAAQR